MANEQERFKMYKAGKQWITAGLFSNSKVTDDSGKPAAKKSGHQWLLASATAVGVFTGGLGMSDDGAQHTNALSSLLSIDSASAATVNQMIDTVTDAENGNRSLNLTDGAAIKNNMSVQGSAYWQNNSGLTNNEQYTTLVTGTNQTGYQYLNKQFSAAQSWTISGHLQPDGLRADGGNNTGDWLGIIVAGIDPKDMINGWAGSGLGIRNIPNAMAFGIDMHRNLDQLDPAAGPVVSWRQTDSSGSLMGVGNDPFSKDDVTQWSLGSTGLKYQVSWNPSTGKLTGMIWDANGNLKANYDLTPAKVPSFFSVSLDASTGSSSQKMNASMTSVQGTLNYAPVKVNYVDANGNTLKTSTTVNANIADKLGITGLSPNAATDDYTYSAATIPGYYAKSATDVTVSSTSSNTMTITYAKESQTARVLTDATDPNGAKTVESATGTSGSAISLSSADSTLARTGYNYTVKAPNGQTYATLLTSFTTTRSTMAQQLMRRHKTTL